jgi:hypothetical protein
LPSADAALVHVHNLSSKLANNVCVWALCANASTGLPALPDGFVKKFEVTGKITPVVPSGSPCRQIGRRRL